MMHSDLRFKAELPLIQLSNSLYYASTEPCLLQHPDLRVVGLPDLLLVDADLILVLGPQLVQGLGQLALKLLLVPAVNLHHARLVPTLGLTQLLQTQTGW